MTKPPNTTELEAFRDAAQSLKLYRRAELRDEGGELLIEELYVDPLPNDHVLAMMLKPSTTFLVGRKGTGKSTIFQRAQHDLRRTSGAASAYVDIKTVFESSQVDQQLLTRAAGSGIVLSAAALERLLLYRAFLAAVIEAIRDELRGRIKTSVWQKVKRKVGGSLDELFEDLDELLADADADRFISVLGARREQLAATIDTAEKRSDRVTASVSLGREPNVALGAETGAEYNVSTAEEREYADVLMRVFDIKEYIARLRELLGKVSIRNLYVFVDDFSELPPDAMRVVVDSILAPLNNWSEELIKFKVAAYPGRIYYGQIDKTKIDEIDLDIFSLYGGSSVNDMEEKAVDFTRRMIERRFEHFGAGSPLRFFAADHQRDPQDLWRQLFFATMANPRNLGYVLLFLYEAHVIYSRPVSLTAVREAAQRYYVEKIEAYFNMNRFLQETFAERSSIFSLKELLDDIVLRARELRTRGDGSSDSRARSEGGRPPTSHFHVASELEGLLATLELNFFLTKYYVQADRDSRKVTVFALNYGLCQKETIEFGRPTGQRENRTYFIERRFDYTPILQEYLRVNQEISCPSCGSTYDNEQLPALRLFGMQCPRCKTGVCEVVNISRKYAATLERVDNDALLPRVEIGIIHTLGTEARPLYAAEVAGELDCSYQLIGKRARFLSDRGLVDRSTDKQNRRTLTVTPRARDIYLGDFDESESEEAE